jgi:hypothetical protein
MVLVVEAPVGVLSKKCLPHNRESIDLEEPQSFLKGVVDFDLATSTGDDNTASAGESKLVRIAICWGTRRTCHRAVAPPRPS